MLYFASVSMRVLDPVRVVLCGCDTSWLIERCLIRGDTRSVVTACYNILLSIWLILIFVLHCVSVVTCMFRDRVKQSNIT